MALAEFAEATGPSGSAASAISSDPDYAAGGVCRESGREIPLDLSLRLCENSFVKPRTQAVILAALLAGCGGSDDEDVFVPPPDPVCPPSTADRRYIAFSGYCWEVRKTSQPQAAGPNYYSNDERDVWVDADRKLHIRISYRDGKWNCAEIFAGGFGYGTYTFRIGTPADVLDRNAVLGLFTWDDACFETGALSELDIELTKWGGFFNNLHYSVQPTHGPDTEEGWYPERSESTFISLAGDTRSTHAFTWARGYVNFASYQGHAVSDDRLIASWQFLSSNPARRADTTTLSTPVVIPSPSATTTARISLWLYDNDKDGVSDPPAGGQEIEVIVDSFQYEPL